MKVAYKLKAYVCGVLLLCTAASSAALTLGRAQGAIFVGKPLDLRVQLQFDASEDVQAACMDAEVFYGDTPLEAARVAVSLESAGARGPSVRVTSPVLINEPIVTVNFRVGCQQKLSKRYTLFPEVASNVVEPAATQPTPRSTLAPATVPNLPVVSAQPAQVEPASRAERPPRKPRPTTASPMERSAAQPARNVSEAPPPAAPAVRSKPAAKGGGKSRLKLDPLDLLIDHDPVLQATPELLTLPQENPAARAEAAALWRSLNTSPEELMLQEAKAKAFEKDLKALYAVTAQNQKGLMDLVAQVQRAESERYANALVYTLAGLCVLALAALVWMWRRSRAAGPASWRDGLDTDDSLLAELVQAPPVSRPRAPQPADESAVPDAVPPARELAPASTSTSAPVSASGMVPLDLDLDAFDVRPPAPPPVEHVRPSFADLAPPRATVPRPLSAVPSRPAALSGARDFSISVAGGLRAIDSTELLDVRQQAAFFLSLGEVQNAIDVLVNHIAQVGESSPLVCLDLLKIYYKEGREPEYEALRHEFNNWFTGRVPPIDDFMDEGRSLEKYPKVIDQIVALWPDPRVLEYIENCIYHHSSDAYEPDFDLLAYRELLLLHGVAKRIVRTSDEGSDSQAAGLVRIPARAPSGDTSIEGPNGNVAHRVGAQHRGAWKRNPVPVPKPRDPQADVETRGSPLGDDPTTDFNFLDLR